MRTSRGARSWGGLYDGGGGERGTVYIRCASAPRSAPPPHYPAASSLLPPPPEVINYTRDGRAPLKVCSHTHAILYVRGRSAPSSSPQRRPLFVRVHPRKLPFPAVRHTGVRRRRHTGSGLHALFYAYIICATDSLGTRRFFLLSL